MQVGLLAVLAECDPSQPPTHTHTHPPLISSWERQGGLEETSTERIIPGLVLVRVLQSVFSVTAVHWILLLSSSVHLISQLTDAANVQLLNKNNGYIFLFSISVYTSLTIDKIAFKCQPCYFIHLVAAIKMLEKTKPVTSSLRKNYFKLMKWSIERTT